MPPQSFYLLGDTPAAARSIAINDGASFYDLQDLVAANFAIVVASGIGFVRSNEPLLDVHDILSSEDPVAVSIDGYPVREVPGPKGQAYIGNFLEVFPDHLGNHERLFEKYGPIFQETNLGATIFQTNNPDLAAIAFAESDFFTKKIIGAHPLAGIKNPEAGVFLGDTDTAEWRAAHKFLPPALGPKAVRHYAPTMQKTIEEAYKVFDELDQRKESWNVYMYMLKLGSQAVAKLMMGLDLKHFEEIDSPLHEIVQLIAETLSLNKKVTSWGSWYAKMPFGNPKLLRDKQARLSTLVEDQVRHAESGGIEDLPLQDAAMQAANMIDYAVRAADNKGEKLPKAQLKSAIMVATGAGFTTTSSLLSWLIYSLVTYPGVQKRLLQELIDNNFDDEMEMTSDFTDQLVFLDHFIKETQRRHNPSFQPGRTAKVDLILPGGYRIPKDSVIIPALHHIHNNPSLWNNPATFDPDRWDTQEVKSRHKAAYIPFATGPRMCIGFNFALQEIKVFLPKLVYRYKFFRDGSETIEYDPMFQLIRPNNLYVRAERRVKWPPKSEVAP
ncbi:cytochrome P450 [Setomelanomma holmii]|uniref:Cytochrome P450 n=1 Tax=Setomelanomma holmii TaxID=210430 RepID=A0A9P4H3G7_9PLEO|nr:cytochrome P450 [Setomelanomma holmii]